MKYRLLFYKPKWGDKHAIDNIISLGTKLMNWRSPRASHVECWLPDGTLVDMDGFMRITKVSMPCPDKRDGCCTMHFRKVAERLGTCLTSTMRGDDNGTVMRPASKVLKHPKRWFYYELECDEADFGTALDQAKIKCADNKGYAMRTLLKFIGINWKDPERNICSQVCHWWAVQCGNMNPPCGIPSPRRLAKMCQDLGLIRKELT